MKEEQGKKQVSQLGKFKLSKTNVRTF